MSAAHVYVISCDAPGCKARVGGWTRATDGRKDLMVVGWRYEVVKVTKSGPAPTIDLCPEHVGLDARSLVKPRAA